MALSGHPDGPEDYDALAEARRAARRAGMTLGEWLDAVVERRTADDRQERQPHGAESTGQAIAAIRARLEEFVRRHGGATHDESERQVSSDLIRRLEERLDAIARGNSRWSADHERQRQTGNAPFTGTTHPGGFQTDGGPAPIDSGLKESIAEIAARQRSLEQEFDQAMAGYTDRIDHRMDRVAERLERTIEEASPKSEMRSVEEELRALVARLASEPNAPAPDLRSELSELAQRLDDLPPRLADEMAGRLEDAARRLDTATRAEFDSIRAEMREIAQDIDRATRSGFDEVRAELAQMMARMTQHAPEDRGPIEAVLDPEGRAELAAIRDDINNLARQLDGTHRENYDALRGELRELSGRLDTRSPARLHELERHLDTLIERMGTEPAAEKGAELAEIERQIAHLVDRFEAAPDRFEVLQRQLDGLVERIGSEPAAAAGGELAEIERQIARLADRFDDAPDRFQELQNELERLVQNVGQGSTGSDRAELAEIERQIARLADGLEAGQPHGSAALEQRLDELLRYVEESQATGGPLAALQGELAALKANVDQANERNQATLGALHHTLNKIVERLNELEDEVEEVAESAWQSASPQRSEEVAAPVAEDAKPLPSDQEPQIGTDDIIGRIEAVTRSFKAGSDDHTPLAPGSGPPGEAVQAPDDEPTAPRATRDDFIAAARRAAQAATAESVAASGEGYGSADASLLERLSAYRRPLLIAAAVAVIILGGLQIASMVARSPVDTPAPAVEDPSGPASTEPEGEPVEGQSLEAEPAVESRLELPRVIGLSQRSAGAGITTGSTTSQTSDLSLTDFQTPVAPSTIDPPDEATELSKSTAPAPPATQLPAAEIGSERLRQAAADGEPAAQFEVAVRYTEGRGVAQDLVKAAHWYRLAAAQGLAPAQYRLGSLYEKGHGVPRDLAMARSWYQRAADQGNRIAMHNLAVLHAEGADSEPDYEQAALWFRQSSEYGLKDSQYNLAILYARGLGVEQNLTESYRWFAAAADQGDAEAAVQRDELARRLDPDALATARLGVQSWQPKPLVQAANSVTAPDGGWDEVAAAPIDARELVREAQELLNRLGYAPGPIDGQTGVMTRRAVIEFQRAAGLPETGEITAELLDQLHSEAG